MLEPIITKEPTKLDAIKTQLDNLEAKVQQMDAELTEVKVLTKKRPSIGYYRARFKGG